MAERVRQTRTKKIVPSDAATKAAVPSGGASQAEVVLDPILTMNTGGVIQSASDSVERVFGWTPTELYGRNLSELVPEPKRSSLDRYLDRYRKPGPPKMLTRSHRFDALRKDGAEIQIELSLSRADLPGLPSSYFVGIVRDVSRSIDIDTDPMVERSQLQQLVTEQTRALATSHLRLLLADRLSTLGTLSAGLGHDINNVLLPVRARLNALDHSGLSEGALSHVAVVRSAVAYLQHLCDGLHHLAPDSGSTTVTSATPEVTSLNAWWVQVGPLLRLAVPSEISFSSTFEPGLRPVTIAAHGLTQAVLNILVNAGEAIPKGNRNPSVRISAVSSDDGQSVKLSITDNGRGMTPAVSRHAFDLFFTTKSRQMGTGLGLPLARKVIVRSGGSVEFSTRTGKGTTVVVTLPVAPQGALVRVAALAKPTRPSAIISLKEGRLAALYAQVLLAAGISVRVAKPSGVPTRGTDLWFVQPTRGVLERATRWRKGRPDRHVVCIGEPTRKEAKMWASIGVIVTPADNYQSIRTTVLTLAEALDAHSADSKT